MKTQHKNEQGIAIVIVIAIMAALIMIATALLATVSRMGDTAKAYKHDSVVKLGVVALKAKLLNGVDQYAQTFTIDGGVDPLDDFFSGDSLSANGKALDMWYDKDMRLCDGGSAFYSMKYLARAVRLNNLAYCGLKRQFSADGAGNGGNALEDALLGDIKNNLASGNFPYPDAQGTTVSEISVFNKKINSTDFANALHAMWTTEEQYSHVDLGRIAGEHKLIDAAGMADSGHGLLFASLPFSCFQTYYGEDKAPADRKGRDAFRAVYTPKWMLANMVSRYLLSTHSYKDQLDISILTKFVKHLVDYPAAEHSEGECINMIMNGDGEIPALFNGDANQGAALEDLLCSLFGPSDKFKHRFSAEDLAEYIAGTKSFVSYTGKYRVGVGNDDPVAIYRVFVHVGLVHVAKDETVASRCLEVIVDNTNHRILSQRWMEEE